VADGPGEFAAALVRLRAAARESAHAEAVAWSRERRARFEAMVAGSIEELTGAVAA
jgi:hypothetical protein